MMVRNLLLALAMVSLTSLVLLADLRATVLVLASVILTLVDVVGLMYYWGILQKSDNELVKKVFRAQQLSPVKHDLCLKVQEDLEYLEIDLNGEEICSMKKIQFKKLMNSKSL